MAQIFARSVRELIKNKSEILSPYAFRKIPRHKEEFIVFMLENKNEAGVRWALEHGIPKNEFHRVTTKIILESPEMLKYAISLKIPFEVFPDAIDSVNSAEILEHWRNAGLPMRYTNIALDRPDTPIEVLDWWFNSGLPLKYTAKMIELASVAKLDWIAAHTEEMPICLYNNILDRYSAAGRVDALKWLIKNIQLSSNNYTTKALNSDNIDVLEWWHTNNKLPLKIDVLTISTKVSVRNWWLQSGRLSPQELEIYRDRIGIADPE